jgi:diguanylate cyclase (GGDEF)-like protein/PAS domain S-box-containing protein
MSIAPLVNRLLGRLGVGRKLMLIYLLDLTAVIYVSGILINEKFIAIDFARKEVQGSAYIAALREPLLAAARLDSGDVDQRTALPPLVAGVTQAQSEHGAGMDSQRLARELEQTLLRLAAAPGPTAGDALVAAALQQGRDLLTRVGNQSNLILDPDLDSYYTMSLIVLRYPELLDVVHGMGRLLQQSAQPGGGADLAQRTRYLVAEGRLGAVAQSIVSDHAEAYAAGGTTLAAALRPHEAALAQRIDAFRQAARSAVDTADGRAHGAAVAAQRLLLGDLRAAWAGAGLQLDGLLATRIHGLYVRMAMHLGTALALLLVILTVVTVVARSIARPLRHLAGVADEVRRTGDHTLRASWEGRDEIGRLVSVFNGMLGELDRERIVKQELVASARAAEAERALIEATPIAMVVTAIPGHEVLHANPPAGAWLGGRRGDPWKDGLDASVRGRFFQQLADRGAVDEFEVRWRGERAWAVLAARRVRWQGQDAVLTTFTPINHLKLMEKRLELWAKVFEASSEAIVIVDAERRILSANQAFSRHTGYELQEVLGEPPGLMLGGSAGLPDALWHSVMQRGSWQGEVVVRRRVGSEYPAWLVVNAVRQQGASPDGGGSRLSAGEVSHCIFTSIDISDRKKSEQRIRFLAEHDVLTELPNRSLCIERLRLAVQQARRATQRVAVLFIDLDRFKQINDSLGHHIGDGLLRSVARRLADGVREGDTVSRLGGDEFVVVLGGVQTVDEIALVVEQRLIPRIREPHAVEGAELHVSCSVGIAVFPDDATDIDELMRHADTAMYQAKAQGRDSAQFFSAEMATRAQSRLAMEAQLRHALELGQLHLVWQPRVAAAGAVLADESFVGTVTGAEGLLRWQHPTLGLVPPSQFIPVAEETGLIVPIGAWVIEQACRQIAAWLAEGLPPMTVAINLSARQLRDAGLIDTVRVQLARHRVPIGALELELTESMVMDGAEHNLAQLHALRDLGVGLAVDDFGTGYSSLAYLSRFPIDKLKIDRSFVHDMVTDPADRAITTAVIGLGHALDLKVVAEGVEDDAQAALLRESGCDELQGYLIARPMPADALTAWVRQARQPLRLAFTSAG